MKKKWILGIGCSVVLATAFVFVIGRKRIIGATPEHLSTCVHLGAYESKNENEIVTYPHEWPVSMFKDAIICHLTKTKNFLFQSDQSPLEEFLPKNNRNEAIVSRLLTPLLLMQDNNISEARMLLKKFLTDPEEAEAYAQALPEWAEAMKLILKNKNYQNLAKYIQAEC